MVITVKKDQKNSNCFNVYIDGKYYTNVGAETEERAMVTAQEFYNEDHSIKAYYESGDYFLNCEY